MHDKLTKEQFIEVVICFAGAGLVVAALETSDTWLLPVLVGVAFLVGYLPGLWSRLKVRPKCPTSIDPARDMNEPSANVGARVLRAISSADVQNSLDLVNSGRKLEAVKMVRALAGVGLKEAKDAVDLLDQFGSGWDKQIDHDFR